MKENHKGMTDQAVLDGVKDELERRPYAIGLKNFLANCETPLTVAIQGGWGVGKTSIMNMVKKELSEDKNCFAEIIEFNPWEISLLHGNSYVAVDFLEEILQMLLKSPIISQDTKTKFAKVANGFIKDMSKAYLGDALGGAVSNAVNTIVGDVEEPSYSKKLQDMKKQLEEFVDNYQVAGADKDNSRIIFFIDDMDRISPKLAVDMLEIFKLFFDMKKCIFVLSIDTDIVFAGIKEKYGNSISDEKARAFFGKIIQMPFQIPPMTNSLGDYLKLPFDTVDKNDEKWISEALYLISEDNPREVKRFNNALALKNEIFEASEKENYVNNYFVNQKEAERTRFRQKCLILETGLSLYYPKLYSKMKFKMSYNFLNQFLQKGYRLEGAKWNEKDVAQVLEELSLNHTSGVDAKLVAILQLYYQICSEYIISKMAGPVGPIRQMEYLVKELNDQKGNVGPEDDSIFVGFVWMDYILSAHFYREKEVINNSLDGGEYVYSYYCSWEDAQRANGKVFTIRYCPCPKNVVIKCEEKIVVQFHKEFFENIAEEKQAEVLGIYTAIEKSNCFLGEDDYSNAFKKSVLPNKKYGMDTFTIAEQGEYTDDFGVEYLIHSRLIIDVMEILFELSNVLKK